MVVLSHAQLINNAQHVTTEDEAVLPRALYTTAEVAEMCGVTSAQVRRWIERGNLAASPIPGHIRIPATEVDRLRSGAAA